MLKKITMLFFAVAITTSAFAQKEYEYKKFRVDIAGGAAIYNGGGGPLFYVEPKLAVHPNFNAGIRLFNAFVAKTIERNGSSVKSEISNSFSALLTGDYYFTSSTARPFVGAGLGVYNNAALAVNDNNQNGNNNSNTTQKYDVIPSSTNFGGMIRAGVDVAHVRIGVEYNFVPSTSAQYGVNTITDNRTQNSFFALTIGGYFGGGKLK